MKAQTKTMRDVQKGEYIFSESQHGAPMFYRVLDVEVSDSLVSLTCAPSTTMITRIHGHAEDPAIVAVDTEEG